LFLSCLPVCDDSAHFLCSLAYPHFSDVYSLNCWHFRNTVHCV